MKIKVIKREKYLRIEKILKKEFTFREGLLFILYFSMVFSICALILMYTVILNSQMFILDLFFDWVNK